MTSTAREAGKKKRLEVSATSATTPTEPADDKNVDADGDDDRDMDAEEQDHYQMDAYGTTAAMYAAKRVRNQK